MRRKLAITIAISSLFAMSAANPASAVDIKKMMKDIVDKNVLNKGGGGGAQAATMNNLNMHKARLQQQINDGIASGKLTSTEASELTNELNQIKSNETTFLTDGKFTDPEVIQLVKALEALESKIGTYTNNAATTKPGTATVAAPTVTTPVTSTPVTTPTAPVTTTSNNLQVKIAQSLAAGKITRTEANDLFKIETRIHSLESQLRANTTGSFESNRSMFRELEQLTQAVNNKLGSH